MELISIFYNLFPLNIALPSLLIALITGVIKNLFVYPNKLDFNYKRLNVIIPFILAVIFSFCFFDYTKEYNANPRLNTALIFQEFIKNIIIYFGLSALFYKAKLFLFHKKAEHRENI